MDYSLLSRVIHELDARLRGCRIERVLQDARGDLFLIVAGKGKRAVLLLSPERTLPRIHLVSARPDQPSLPAPAGFGLFLKSHITGAAVRAVSTLNEDRIAEIRCARTGKEYRVIFELFGPHSNLLLCDGSLRILAVLRPVPPAAEKERMLVAGVAYELPRRRRGPPDSGGRETAAPECTALQNREEIPCNRAAERYYERRAKTLMETRVRQEISRLLERELRKARRKAAAVRDDLLSAEKAEAHRKAGDLLLANLASLRKGMKTAVLTGPNGAVTVVELDPRRTPAENAEACFRKYKKAKSGRELLSRRMEEISDDISRLERCRAEIDAAGTIGALEAVRTRLMRGGASSGGVEIGNAAGKSPAGPYRSFRFSGWVILVGKSAAGNDMITRELSRPDDLWLHAEGVSGSHVLIRNPDRAEVPRNVLLKAASLAALYSRAKGEAKVSVAYTEARYVKRQKGARPGLVTLMRRKSVVVEPESGEPLLLDK